MLVKSRSIFLFLTLSAASAFAQPALDEAGHLRRIQPRQQRQEEFYRTRSFPGKTIPPGARAAAIESDPEIRAVLSPEQIAAAFSLDRQLRSIYKIFARVFPARYRP